jgi:hypothetical protein
VALFYVHLNTCHIGRNAKATPAMLAGVLGRVWDVGDLLVLSAVARRTACAVEKGGIRF